MEEGRKKERRRTLIMQEVQQRHDINKCWTELRLQKMDEGKIRARETIFSSRLTIPTEPSQHHHVPSFDSFLHLVIPLFVICHQVKLFTSQSEGKRMKVDQKEQNNCSCWWPEPASCSFSPAFLLSLHVNSILTLYKRIDEHKDKKIQEWKWDGNEVKNVPQQQQS